MAKGKVKIDSELLDKAKKVAETAGYSTVDEFVSHLLEKELKKVEDAVDEEELKERLRGLGYIS